MCDSGFPSAFLGQYNTHSGIQVRNLKIKLGSPYQTFSYTNSATKQSL